jgi:hypothetical protein
MKPIPIKSIRTKGSTDFHMVCNRPIHAKAVEVGVHASAMHATPLGVLVELGGLQDLLPWGALESAIPADATTPDDWGCEETDAKPRPRRRPRDDDRPLPPRPQRDDATLPRGPAADPG